MRVFIEIELPFVEVETHTGHGEIEAVWMDGDDWANKSVAEFVRACFGSDSAFRQALIIAEENARESIGEDRSTEHGVPL